jgi:hypothetical protein
MCVCVFKRILEVNGAPSSNHTTRKRKKITLKTHDDKSEYLSSLGEIYFTINLEVYSCCLLCQRFICIEHLSLLNPGASSGFLYHQLELQ